ncbi:MAG: type IV-A pilus assembly ATPase PilB [Candidatus Coatesbacteria bacterium]|nr:type IV-A pilus assembly ATPase PilB [Candidatus Coatesbacteria bacterium]
MLVESGIITDKQLEVALSEQRKSGGRIGYTLIRFGFATEDDIAKALGQQYNLPSINLSNIILPSDTLSVIPAEVAQKHQVVPVARKGKILEVAMIDPFNIHAIDDIEFVTGYRVKPLVCPETTLTRALKEYYDVNTVLTKVINEIESDEGEVEVVDEGDDGLSESEVSQAINDAPVIKLVNDIISEAVKREASDIHVEPFEKEFVVRYRIDGACHDVMHPPMSLKNAIISRIKIMSEMNIAEKRVCQDGRIKINVQGRTIDLRVSAVPVLAGEKIVMRILDKGSLSFDLTVLGFPKASLDRFIKAIESPFGIVLVTGPTGSGKTTTLYSALSRLNKETVHIMTAEDPIEYHLDGLNQVQIHEEIGLDFANTLRAMLRQDPNIIMVGEIRDHETAAIAIKASLTGHLVLSTIHTNDAPSTIHRLIDMGIQPFLVSSATRLIMAQRLVKKICPRCKEKVTYKDEKFEELDMNPNDYRDITLYKGKGCSKCNNTGYKGRIGIYEVMSITNEVRELILEKKSTQSIKKLATDQGMITLRGDAILKMVDGITTLEEVKRVTASD